MGLFGDVGVVGLEIDTGVIRAVEMRGSGESAKIVAAGQVDIPEKAVRDGVVVDVDVISEALKQLWTGVPLGSRNVVLGVFNQGVIIRSVNFPKVPEDKLDQALRLEAAEIFPIPMSQLVFDYAVVGEKVVSDGSQYEVLLVAAKKSQLEQIVKAVIACNLVPKTVDVSPLALLRVLPQEKLTGTIAVVELANGLSSLLLAINGVPHFARVMPVALKHYIKDIESSIGKKKEDSAMETRISFEIFKEWGMSVAKEIRLSTSFYLNRDNLGDVDRIIISGRGAGVTGLQEFLHDELGMPVDVIDPLANISVANNLGIYWDTEGPSYAASIGLALRGLED